MVRNHLAFPAFWACLCCPFPLFFPPAFAVPTAWGGCDGPLTHASFTLLTPDRPGTWRKRRLVFWLVAGVSGVWSGWCHVAHPRVVKVLGTGVVGLSQPLPPFGARGGCGFSPPRSLGVRFLSCFSPCFPLARGALGKRADLTYPPPSWDP